MKKDAKQTNSLENIIKNTEDEIAEIKKLIESFDSTIIAIEAAPYPHCDVEINTFLNVKNSLLDVLKIYEDNLQILRDAVNCNNEITK